MSNDDLNYITRPHPLDVTSVQDDGMKVLCILAASMGWNVHQKVNQPVVLTSREGFRKSFPTNTSVRMSVYQQGISTILAYSDYHDVPTIELMDAILATVKPSADHQRRLRLAVGETPAQHRERVANDKAGQASEPQPLTTRIELPQSDVPDALEWAEPPAEETVATVEVTADHGELVSREPFMAMRQRHGNRVGFYQSDTSYERVWSDGYKDYECQRCGKVFPTPKGVGSHAQTHKDRDLTVRPWERAGGPVFYADAERKEEHASPRPREEEEPVEELTDSDQTLHAVIALVTPGLVRRIQDMQRTITEVSDERDELRRRYEKLRGDYKTMRDLFLEAEDDGD